jgi:putative MFS transporter
LAAKQRSRETTVEAVLSDAGTGPFQQRLLGVFGLVWTADAMQVLAVGFTAPSIAATFGLTIPEALQTGTLFFLGMLVGAALFGRLADRYGRRRILLATVALDAVFGLLSVFAPSFEILLVLRFVTGLAVGGTLPVDYAMMAEFLPARQRGRWLVALEGFWAVGTVLVALAAWAASSAGVADAWRWIFACTAAPALVGIWLRFWVPESPLYLLKTQRADEARAVLNRVLAANGKPATRLRISAGPTAPARDGGGIFTGPLMRRTLLILTVWLLVSAAYYGVFVWLPGKLASGGFGFVRGYGFLVVVALAQIPGYVLAAWGVERLGRRPTLIGFLVLSAAGCLLFTQASSGTLIAAAILLMSFALLGTWGALYAFTPELYPTRSRATGMGAAGAMARFGGLLAPTVMTPIMAISFNAAIGLFAALLLLAVAATWAIDVETRRVPLD